MMNLFFIILFLIVFVLFLIHLFYTVRIDVPPFATDFNKIKIVLENLGDISQKTVYDLGSGSGRFVFQAAAHNPRKIVGWEASLLPFLISRLRLMLAGHDNIEFKFADFHKHDLSAADAVYCWLKPEKMAELSKKLEQNLKHGTKVIIMGASLPGWKAHRQIKLHENGYSFYVYQK